MYVVFFLIFKKMYMDICIVQHIDLDFRSMRYIKIDIIIIIMITVVEPGMSVLN